MLDKWVKVIKYQDTSDCTTTPIIKDKTVSLTTPIAHFEAMAMSVSLERSPQNGGQNGPTKPLYERMFAPFKCPKGSVMPDHYPLPPMGYRNVLHVADGAESDSLVPCNAML